MPPNITRHLTTFTMMTCLISLTACEPTSTSTSTIHNELQGLPQIDDYNRNLTLRFVDELRWIKAKNQYQNIKRYKYDLTVFDKTIETKLLSTLTTLSDEHYNLGIQGYEFLLILQPDNLAFKNQLTRYQSLKTIFQKTAVSKLETNTDKIEGITWYSHPDLPQHSAERSGIDLYIGRVGDGPPTLRMKTQYTAKDWLFVNKVLAWHDGVKEQLVVGRFKRGNTGGVIWEWDDTQPSEYQIAILESLSHSEEVILRFKSANTSRDITISKKDKHAYADVLAAFKAMQEESEKQ